VSVETRPVRPLSTPGNFFATAFVRLLVGLLSRMSVRARDRLGAFLGRLVFALGIRKKVTLDNLARAMPELDDAARYVTARSAYVSMARAAVDGLTSSYWSEQDFEQMLEVNNWQAFEAAHAQGRGVLAATAHFGSWELLGRVMKSRGVSFSGVVRPLKGAFNAQIVENRRRNEVKLIAARGAVHGTLKALAQGDAVLVTVDQVMPKDAGIFVPFFGRPASTSPLLSICALRSKSPVMFLFPYREEGRMRLRIEGPIEVPATGDTDADVRRHTAEVTARLENEVRKNPGQWNWLHRRWKVQPD
jgi:Kdo2-lipid IVA lauroyltransferase/acyltransferase